MANDLEDNNSQRGSGIQVETIALDAVELGLQEEYFQRATKSLKETSNIWNGAKYFCLIGLPLAFLVPSN